MDRDSQINLETVTDCNLNIHARLVQYGRLRMFAVTVSIQQADQVGRGFGSNALVLTLAGPGDVKDTDRDHNAERLCTLFGPGQLRAGFEDRVSVSKIS